ncbi:MAG: uracil-DNA glycosylase family protein [Hyphomicrobiales bacterium]
MTLDRISDDLLRELKGLQFAAPVSCVYNPLEYAREPYRQYLRRFGKSPKRAVLVGMNPGPYGMVQTGVPFGEIVAVRDWMRIEAPIGRPERLHPKRPVEGFACTRREVSGRRLWEWAQKNFGKAEDFFKKFFVANYCPLMFIGSSGINLTPDKLKTTDARVLFVACDRALRRTIEVLKPEHAVGVGQFATERARIALAGLGVKVGGITHPSPANPKANRGWESIINKELQALGIKL